MGYDGFAASTKTLGGGTLVIVKHYLLARKCSSGGLVKEF
jgi:hypothetical protein